MIHSHYFLSTVLCGVALLISRSTEAQSFDCKKAVTVIEEAICNDAAVSELDRQLANAVNKQLGMHPDWKRRLLLAERHWLQYRDAQCSGFAGDTGRMDVCLRAQYEQRLAVVESSDPLGDPVAKATPTSILALGYRERMHAAALPLIDRAAIAGINVPSAPAPVDEIFDQCAALAEGLARRLPERYAPLKSRYATVAAGLTNRPADREAVARLEFSQCSWLRTVATQCLEPTSYYGVVKSPVERLAQNVPVGKVFEDTEDDCMSEAIAKRSADLDTLSVGLGKHLAEEIARRIPPLTMFGFYISRGPRACVAGDPQAWALDPHFDNWVDCSQTPQVLVLGTTLDDSLSGISVWVGTPMYEGDAHAFAGTAIYQQGQDLLATSMGVCPLNMKVEQAGMSVGFMQSANCDMPSDGEKLSSSEVHFRLVSTEQPAPADSSRPVDQIQDFVNDTKPGRVWIRNGREVSVAWILGLNRSLQTSSDCSGLPAYEHLVQFFANYRTSVMSGNVSEVAELTAFPLQIDGAATEFVKDSAELKSQFTRVFPSTLVGVLRDLDPHFVYCQRGHVMVAAGRVWAKSEVGALRVYFVDSHAEPLATPKGIRPN